MLSAVKEGEKKLPHRALGLIDNSKAKNNNLKNTTELTTKKLSHIYNPSLPINHLKSETTTIFSVVSS